MKASSSFLKKRTKKLMGGCRGVAGSMRQKTKVLWFFLSRKNCLLALVA
jgi:hypothetical protein